MNFGISDEIGQRKGGIIPAGQAHTTLAICSNYSPGVIAPVGQTSAQAPQSMQVSGFIS